MKPSKPFKVKMIKKTRKKEEAGFWLFSTCLRLHCCPRLYHYACYSRVYEFRQLQNHFCCLAETKKKWCTYIIYTPNHTLINEREKKNDGRRRKRILSSSHPPIEISDNLVVQSICKRKSRQFEQHSTIIVKNIPPK